MRLIERLIRETVQGGADLDAYTVNRIEAAAWAVRQARGGDFSGATTGQLRVAILTGARIVKEQDALRHKCPLCGEWAGPGTLPSSSCAADHTRTRS